MKTIKKLFILFFFLSSLMSILSIYFFRDFFIIIKPMTLMSLAFLFMIYFIKTRKVDKYKIFILAGVLSGFMAQFFFISDKTRVAYFFGGLAFFLIGHVFYILGFSKAKFSVNPLIITIAALVGISYDMFLAFHILPVFGVPVLIAIVVYTFFLVSMFMFALNFDLAQGGKFGFVAAGGLIFVISDMIFSYFIFVNQFWFGDVAVLSTYFAAQGLIGFGMLSYFFKE